MKRKSVLTIAGSDCSGGAGIQADLKTMLANGVYGMSAVTALTAQNTTGVYGIMESTPEFLRNQLECIFQDIFPVKWKAENIVVDPVMVATSGSSLLQDEAKEALESKLLPLAAVITPNIPEAEVLSGIQIDSPKKMEEAASILGTRYPGAVLIKGGHDMNDANDLLFWRGKMIWFRGERIDNPNTHGTGCTLSSAIASNLAKGYGMEKSIERAKQYISGALGAGLDLGKGSGPMDHGYALPAFETKDVSYEEE